MTLIRFLLLGLAGLTLTTNAYAATGAPPEGNPMSGMLMLAFFFGLMYVFMIRPQQKRAKEHRNLLANLSKDDEVVTNGGLLGKITHLDDQFVTLALNNSASVMVQRQAITAVLTKGTMDKITRS